MQVLILVMVVRLVILPGKKVFVKNGLNNLKNTKYENPRTIIK